MTLICSVVGTIWKKRLDDVGEELKKLKSWFDSNKLTINLNKTKCIIFGNGQTCSTKKLITNDRD